jgi:hypothetical protein
MIFVKVEGKKSEVTILERYLFTILKTSLVKSDKVPGSMQELLKIIYIHFSKSVSLFERSMMFFSLT